MLDGYGCSRGQCKRTVLVSWSMWAARDWTTCTSKVNDEYSNRRFQWSWYDISYVDVVLLAVMKLTVFPVIHL